MDKKTGNTQSLFSGSTVFDSPDLNYPFYTGDIKPTIIETGGGYKLIRIIAADSGTAYHQIQVLTIYESAESEDKPFMWLQEDTGIFFGNCKPIYN